ncbi:unnamed protein product, partial [Mesorhabditis belari]|uniref:RNA helicase n=1 Tax=Mesorhabditis belari TaxID=2138241 RepID=A0AAF3F321_9BILA
MSFSRGNRPTNVGRRRNGEERNGFNNPQYGPGTQLIDERWEQEVKNKLDEFARNDVPELRFPPMESHLRKRIHELARRRNLQSKSVGLEGYRQCVITRRRSTNLLTTSTAQETQTLELTDEQADVIERFIQKSPIRTEEIEEHIKTADGDAGHHFERDSQHDARPQVPPICDPTQQMIAFRDSLPVMKYRTDILDAITNNNVTIVTGGTGCGKTTQVPQFLLEESTYMRKPIRIICTQPRRLPAIAVAERVAAERNERVGDTVGYHIRLEQKTSENTVLTYCTSGVLLRMLSQKSEWCGATHVILDEVHERERNTDYLLIALREALKRNFHLKVILMSATLEGNLNLFLDYFKGFKTHHTNVPSRLFTVQKFHLGEVLALTSYTPPQSAFNGGTWGDAAHQSDTFPTVGEFPGAPLKNYQLNRGMHSVQTAPTLHPNSSYSAPDLQNEAFASLAQQLATLSSSEAQQQEHRQDSHYGQSTQTASAANQEPMADVEDLPASDDEEQKEQSPAHAEGNAIYNDYHPQTSMSNQGYGGEYNQPPPQPPWHHQHSVPDFNQIHGGYNQQGSQQYHQQQYQQQQHPHFYLGGSTTYGGENYQYGQGGYPQGNDNYGNGDDQQYAAQMSRGNYEMDNCRRRLGASMFAQKYPTFQEGAINELDTLIKTRRFEENELVNTYLKCGGSICLDNIDADLCYHLIRYLVDSPIDGAILVFLPGFDDINALRMKLETLNTLPPHQRFNNRLVVYALHSQLQSFEQHKVFDRTPKFCRKIILSTNIAEASLTIDDVVFVVDCGKVKEKTYDHDSRISQLKVQWIAKSNAEQRSGRAGRCRPGFCFRLYSQRDYDVLQTTQMAEMQRVAIHEVVLHAKMFAADQTVRDFISKAPEPPRQDTLEYSIQFLQQLGALYANEEEPETTTSAIGATLRGGFYNKKPPPEPSLTSLGRLIAILPLEPQLARLLLFGVALKCVDPIMNLVAMLSHSNDPFIMIPTDQSENREQLNRVKMDYSRRDLSDHLMLIRTMNEYLSMKGQSGSHPQRWCQNKFLRASAMKMISGIRLQLYRELIRCGIMKKNVDEAELNWNSDSWPMIRAAIVAGCYPGIGFVKLGNKLKKIRTSTEPNAQLHASSVVRRQLMHGRPNDPYKKFDGGSTAEPHIEFVIFQELQKIESQLTLKTATVVPPLVMLIFSGAIRLKKSTLDTFRICSIDDDEIPEEVEEESMFSRFPTLSILELDEWFAVRGRFTDLRTLLKLRFRVMDYFLRVMETPAILYTSQFDALLETLRVCLESDHMKHSFNRVIDLPTWEKPDRKNVPSMVPNVPNMVQRTDSEHTYKTAREVSSASQTTTSSSSWKNHNRDKWRHNPDRGGEERSNLIERASNHQRPNQYEVREPRRVEEDNKYYDSRGYQPEPVYQQEEQCERDYQQEQHEYPDYYPEHQEYSNAQYQGSSKRQERDGRYDGNYSRNNYNQQQDRRGKPRPPPPLPKAKSDDVRQQQRSGDYQPPRRDESRRETTQNDYYPKRQNRNRASGSNNGKYYASSSNENQHCQQPRRQESYEDDEVTPEDPPQRESMYDERWKQINKYDNCYPASSPISQKARDEEVLSGFDDPFAPNQRADDFEDDAYTPKHQNVQQNQGGRGGGERKETRQFRVVENSKFRGKIHSDRDRDHRGSGPRRRGGNNQRGGGGSGRYNNKERDRCRNNE